jgi:hypothetical protein
VALVRWPVVDAEHAGQADDLVAVAGYHPLGAVESMSPTRLGPGLFDLVVRDVGRRRVLQGSEADVSQDLPLIGIEHLEFHHSSPLRRTSRPCRHARLQRAFDALRHASIPV